MKCIAIATGVKTTAQQPERFVSESGARSNAAAGSASAKMAAGATASAQHIALRMRSPSEPLGAASGGNNAVHSMRTVGEDSLDSKGSAGQEQELLPRHQQQSSGQIGSVDVESGNGNRPPRGGGAEAAAPATVRDTAPSTIDVSCNCAC